MSAVPCSTSTSFPSMVSLTIFFGAFSGAGEASAAREEVEKAEVAAGAAAASLEEEATLRTAAVCRVASERSMVGECVVTVVRYEGEEGVARWRWEAGYQRWRFGVDGDGGGGEGACARMPLLSFHCGGWFAFCMPSLLFEDRGIREECE